MTALVRVRNQIGVLSFLNGRYGRVTKMSTRTNVCIVEFKDSEIKEKIGADKFRMSLGNVILVTGSRALLSRGLPLAVWQYMNKAEKLTAIKQAIMKCRSELYDDFEVYIAKEASLELFDAFIAKTIQRRDSHYHYGAKAIFEDLRYHSELKDSCPLFKVNNNYTASLSRVVMEIFPETLGFFAKREAGKAAA